MNKIVVNFSLCSPAPPRGYEIGYRVQGSAGPYIDAGNFFISPAIFYDTVNPAGTCYEGYIKSDCADVIGDPVAWVSCEESGEDSGSTTPTPVCRLHEFAVFGGDGENWHISGLNCDGSVYDATGIVGDGAPPNQCLQVGSTNFYGTPVVLTNDTNLCP